MRPLYGDVEMTLLNQYPMKPVNRATAVLRQYLENFQAAFETVELTNYLKISYKCLSNNKN